MLKKYTTEISGTVIDVRNKWIYTLTDDKPTNDEELIDSLKWIFNDAKINIEHYAFIENIKQFIKRPLVSDLYNSTKFLTYNINTRKDVFDKVLYGNKITPEVFYHVFEKFQSWTDSKVNDFIFNQMPENFYKYILPYFSLRTLDLAIFIDVFQQLDLVEKNIKMKKILQFYKSKPFFIYLTDDTCYIKRYPDYIKKHWETDNIHCEDGWAIRFDDTGYFLYDGIEVPGKWIIDPFNITEKEVREEKSAELRTCLMNILGKEKYCELLGIDIEDLS